MLGTRLRDPCRPVEEKERVLTGTGPIWTAAWLSLRPAWTVCSYTSCHELRIDSMQASKQIRRGR